MSKHNGIMICVTKQKACERLIKIGLEKSETGSSKLYVVHVSKDGENYLGNPDEGQALDYLFNISKKVHAEMTVMRSEDVVETLVDFAKQENIKVMILGSSPSVNGDNNIITELQEKLQKVEFIIVPS